MHLHASQHLIVTFFLVNKQFADDSGFHLQNLSEHG